jgi:hypothetical protein
MAGRRNFLNFGLTSLAKGTRTLKTHHIELQRVKAVSNSNGLIRIQADVLVQASSATDHATPNSSLSFTEETARVLYLQLKAQLAEFDGRKAKSRR